MRFKRFLLLLILSVSLICPSSAHPGRTDGKGGHWSSATGEYHYHHGFSAHQHTDGVCPYDFVDKTGQNSGTSGSSTKTKQPTTTVQEESEPSLASRVFKIIILGIVFLLFVLPMCIGMLMFVVGVLVSIWDWIKERFHIETKKARKQRAIQEEKQRVLRADVVICLHQLLQIRQAEEAERILKFAAEKARYMKLYEGKTTLESAGAPPGVEIGSDGLPRGTGDGRWGSLFTFYTSPQGQAFHRVKGCSSSYLETHILHTRQKSPCKRCNPCRVDMLWYDSYLRIKSVKRKYGIPDYVPPSNTAPSDYASTLNEWLASSQRNVPPSHTDPSDPSDFASIFDAWLSSRNKE